MPIPPGTNLTVVPRLTALATSSNVRTLPLSPTDGFVLSRVDGVSSGRDLSAVTGLPGEDVLEAIVKLAELGLVDYPGAPTPRRSGNSRVPPPMPPMPPMTSGTPSQGARASLPPLSHPPYASQSQSQPRPSQMPPARPSNVPPRFDATVKRTISGGYAQVSVDRPASRPPVTTGSRPPSAASEPPPMTERTAPPPSEPVPAARPSRPDLSSGSNRPAPQRPSWNTGPSRFDTPTSVMAQRPPLAPGHPNAQPAAPPSAPTFDTPLPPPPTPMASVYPNVPPLPRTPSSQSLPPNTNAISSASSSASTSASSGVGGAAGARNLSRSPPMIVSKKTGLSLPPQASAPPPPHAPPVSVSVSVAPPERAPSMSPQRPEPSTHSMHSVRPSRPAPQPSPPPAPSPANAQMSTPPGPLSQALAPAASAAAPAAAAAAPNDGIDLDGEQRAKVNHLWENLDSFDYYALLGVERGSDKKVVKRAYYELAASFHPDKFFRKNIGEYKGKMETIFGRLTVAHDALTSKTDRAEYDAYLGVKATTKEHESRLASAKEEIRKAEEDVQRAARHNVPISVPPPPIVEVRAPSVAPASSAAPISSATPFAPPKNFDAQAAREALARKLRGGQTGRQGTNAGPSPPISPSSAGTKPATVTQASASGSPATTSVATPGAPLRSSDAVEALKKRYEQTLENSRSAQIQKYKAAGEASIAKGDFVAGVNALRVALSFDPTDIELEERANAIQHQADSLLAENYEKQALYEEKNDQWAAAAKSRARVARSRPTDAAAQERAAFALLRAQGNVREAADYAKRAVTLDAKNGAYHATLAQAYLVGGMLLNAKREIEIAEQLAPADPQVLAVVKRVKAAH